MDHRPGNDPQDRDDPRNIPLQGGLSSIGNEIYSRNGGTVGITSSGRGYGGSGTRGGVFPPPPENRCPVYSDSSDTGAMTGGKTASRRTSITMVAEAEWN